MEGKPHLNVVKMPPKESDEDNAKVLREYAEMAENGELPQVCIVAMNESGEILTYGSFRERLTLLGAVEYIKSRLTE